MIDGNFPQDKPGSRLYFFDNLRTFVILIVIIFHASLAFNHMAVPWWFVLDAHRSIIFDYFIAFSDIFMMPTLFFIAGYFALPSLKKNGTAEFMKKKLLRIGAPALAGGFLLSPTVLYIRYYHHQNGTGLNFYKFWLTYVKSAAHITFGLIDRAGVQFNYGHLWFLTLLLFFFITLGLLYEFKKKFPGSTAKLRPFRSSSGKPTFIFLLSFGFMNAIGFFLASCFTLDSDWMIIGNLMQFQPTRVFLYATCFYLGTYVFLKNWFNEKNAPTHLALWFMASLLLSLCFAALGKRLFIHPTPGMKFIHGFIRSYLCLSIMMMLAVIFHRKLNTPSMIMERLSLHSYSMYVIHMVIVVYLQFLFVNWKASAWLKFPLISIVSILFCCLVSEYILKHLPIIRKSLF